MAVRREGFCTVEDPMLAVPHGSRARASRIGASFWLGEGPRAEFLSLCERDKIFALLLFGRKFEYVIAAERIMRGYNQPDGTVHAGKFLDDSGIFDVTEARATVLIRKDHAKQAHLREFGKDFRREMRHLIPFHNVGSDLAFGKFANALAELLLFLGKGKIHGPVTSSALLIAVKSLAYEKAFCTRLGEVVTFGGEGRQPKSGPPQKAA